MSKISKIESVTLPDDLILTNIQSVFFMYDGEKVTVELRDNSLMKYVIDHLEKMS